MMRRGGMLGAAPDTQALIPHESDTGQILEAKWKKWVQRESFKRLADFYSMRLSSLIIRKAFDSSVFA
jgi:hypothetical protein